MKEDTMKKIKFLEMGGTISAKGKNRLDLKDYTSGIFTGEDFQQALPEINHLAEVTFESFLRVSSTEVNAQHWIQLREKVIQSLDEEQFDGIVISHGTNTLEESAYFLHLTIPTDKPIVFVGSQRPFTALSSDAHYNIIQAIRVATSDEAKRKGVLIVVNDEISSAREVTKTNTYRLETFQSGEFGYLGFVDPDNKVQFYREPTRKHTIKSEFAHLNIRNLPDIEIVYSYAGARGHLIDYIADHTSYKGLVTAGTGAGLIAPDELAAVKRAKEKGLHIVRSSRVGNGRVMAIDGYETYDFIHGDNLLPQKARILLMLSLLVHDDTKSIQHIFNNY